MKTLVPDGYVFPKILKACAQLKSFHVGCVVHKDVVVFGWDPSLIVCNSLLDMYAKCGDVGSAGKVFDEMPQRDVFSWNSMMACYVCNGFYEKGLEMLDCLRMFEPDVVTWNTVMDAYCRMGEVDEALKVFRKIKDPNVISWATLISGYTGVGKHVVALELFKEMVNVGMILPDVGALSGILVSCRFLGDLRSGREIHGYGIRNMLWNNAFYKSAGPALLTLYARCSRLHDAEKVFRMMDESDVVAWNAMILGYIDMGLGRLALERFREMQGKGVRINDTTVSTILPVCDLRCGKQIHAYIRKNNFNCTVGVYNALIHMYSIGGCIEYAYSVFSTMVKKDLVSWNTIIGGFGMHGLGQTAVKLLQEMSDSGISLDSVTFSSALSACCHSGLVDEGIELFYRMIKDFGLTPVKEHFSCVIDMLGRAGRLEDAFHFINEMPQKPDKYIWGALLAACQKHENVNVGNLAAEKLIDLEPHEASH